MVLDTVHFLFRLFLAQSDLYLLNFPKIKPSDLLQNLLLQQLFFHLSLVLSSASQMVILAAVRVAPRDMLLQDGLNAFMGMIGTGVILAFITISYLIFALKVKPESFGLKLPAFLKFKKHTDNQTGLPG